MGSRLWLTALAALTLSGCGIRSGFLRDSRTTTDLKFDMPISSIRHVKTVTGSADVGMLLCSIPMTDDVYTTAMQRLHGNAQLKENEFLAHFREDQGFTWYLGFYCRMHVTISADVLHVTSAHGHASAPVSRYPELGAPSMPPPNVPSAPPVSPPMPPSAMPAPSAPTDRPPAVILPPPPPPPLPAPQ